MGSLPMLVMFVALLGMWFFMSRTQKKQQQERQNLLDSMKPGDEVVTIGGLHGVISEMDNEKRTVVLDCEGIFLEYDRSAIKTVKPGTTITTDPTVTSVEETKVEETTVVEDPAPSEEEHVEVKEAGIDEEPKVK
ncbi:preprotein translocase, YajC subunit [Enterococcus sp. 10A9_DIV0425]|uniref:Preprotein translocase, YajC subunit n=1 Tax=Candidatus Enterococcus wittei TaxID=1987383 RepID=A0A242JVC1_9ENTE|nr:preprotein translocase subunit YajC [Enterococcus sp. 10A9_DIV0425]OTP06739.1 preprotein translocase, YajC subunit [Enterococcus sp. 10A9_DIV0425]THE16230.1 preprotein translocase subunit YajC [Enterococcus hirae]